MAITDETLANREETKKIDHSHFFSDKGGSCPYGYDKMATTHVKETKKIEMPKNEGDSCPHENGQKFTTEKSQQIEKIENNNSDIKLVTSIPNQAILNEPDISTEIPNEHMLKMSI